MEIWKSVPGTDEMITVSSKGRVKSYLRNPNGKILKTQKTRKGYHTVSITINGQKRNYYVHRLTAEAFLENEEHVPQVNHIDCNKDNNNVSNLEWVTNKENIDHAIRNGLFDSTLAKLNQMREYQKKPIIALCGADSIEFESIAEAERYFNSKHITDVLKHRREHVKGWAFHYKGGDD